MKTLCGKFLNLAHYFPHDTKLRLLAHSLSFLANQKARNAIVGAENLLNLNKKLGMDKAFINIHVSTKCPKVECMKNSANFLSLHDDISMTLS